MNKELAYNNILELSENDFLQSFGVGLNDLFSDCIEMFNKGDFRYKKQDNKQRDELLLAILSKLNSDEMWVSGKNKQAVWEEGWLENLNEYDKIRGASALTPKFLQSKKFCRFNGDYIEPCNANFEFDLIDIFRTWVFRKYFSDIEEIYEFGCGSCQHLYALAKMFPHKKLHGLD